MAAKDDKSAKVTAVVVRGSYWPVDAEGNRWEVKPGLGADSEVQVTQRQLEAFAGVLVLKADAATEIAKAKEESMAPPTTAEEATTAPGEASAKKK